MRTKLQFCHSCSKQQAQAVLGFMPLMFTEGEAKPTWKKALVCSVCGDINYDSVNNDEVDRAHRRYLSALVELGIETKESVEDKTGVQL